MLTKSILSLAKKKLRVKIITLSVASVKKMGFKRVSTLPRRFFYNGKYYDLLVFDKEI